jgi:hypothetical protein
MTAALALVAASLSAVYALSSRAQEALQPAPSAPARMIGAVKAVSGNSITLAPDKGGEVTVLVQDSTRMLRLAPGQKDLKDAAPIQLQDIQTGDRIIARGMAADDGKSMAATSIILMKQEDIAAKQEREREDWQKHGVGGLVTAVDPAGGTVTISNLAAGQKSIVIRVSKTTRILRYAPASVKFDDAQPGTLDQIRPGDQLRARGERNAEGNEVAAVEMVSGSFRNVAGRITSVDAARNTLVIMDLFSKKPVTVKIAEESQVRKLPPMVAQRMAMRLKGTAAGTGPAAGSAREMPGGPRTGGAPDLQQVLNRMPEATLADMQKGDAIMAVATQGAGNSEVRAITLLTGVEPILTSGGAATVLTPWSLGESISDAMTQ